MPSHRIGGVVPGRVGAKQRDGSSRQVAVRNGIGRTVGPAELGERMQLHGTAEDVPVERQGRTGSAGKMKVRGRIGHGLTVLRCRSPARKDAAVT